MRLKSGFALLISLTVAGIIVLSCSSDGNNVEKKTNTEAVRTPAPVKYYQTRDAFSGKLVNRTIYADYKGKRIYFCCDNSKADFLNDPERYMRRFQELGVALHDVPTAE